MKQTNHMKRWQLILLLGVFIVPVIAAKLLLVSGFKGEVETHGGELVSGELKPFIALHEYNPERQWHIAYFSNSQCNNSCLLQLYHLQQTYKALGRLQQRIGLIVVSPSSVSPAVGQAAEIDLKLFSFIKPSQNITSMLDKQVVIVDPLGNLVMRYDLNRSKEQQQILAHDMLLDIKQLLKLSRIG
ncbi:hypothetical protein [Psychrobium sp. 1_MG-2023]|uniref:hypothetical protein n=1 Tax=Psychrobium sp. 1_MG-2023 TaxID=3062624 RepID=UPI000C336163|nr:hypothetical protein [Psychrobium sp. 1_MG-2023]MDP2561833.1 hypothetical protein [Psychrobium sp. 1_MG-2023]PKF55795.1 hypothetical protein CW748_11680 [Alteromonadales bacterium alter-6D02]